MVDWFTGQKTVSRGLNEGCGWSINGGGGTNTDYYGGYCPRNHINERRLQPIDDTAVILLFS